MVVLLTISNAYLIQLFSTAFSESSFSTVLQTLLNALPIENHVGTAETATTSSVLQKKSFYLKVVR